MGRRLRKTDMFNIKIICPYCLKEVFYSETNREHLTPLSRGGDNSPDNIIRVCKKCNAIKGALTLEEFNEWKRLEFIRNGGLSR